MILLCLFQSIHCMTVATSTEDDEKDMKSTLTDLPVVILEPHPTISLQTQQQPQIVHIPIPQQQQLNHVTQHPNQPQLQQSAVQTHSQVKYYIYYIFIYITLIYNKISLEIVQTETDIFVFADLKCVFLIILAHIVFKMKLI